MSLTPGFAAVKAQYYSDTGTVFFIIEYIGCLPVGVDYKLLTEERVIFGRVKPAVAAAS